MYTQLDSHTSDSYIPISISIYIHIHIQITPPRKNTNITIQTEKKKRASFKSHFSIYGHIKIDTVSHPSLFLSCLAFTAVFDDGPGHIDKKKRKKVIMLSH